TVTHTREAPREVVTKSLSLEHQVGAIPGPPKALPVKLGSITAVDSTECARPRPPAHAAESCRQERKARPSRGERHAGRACTPESRRAQPSAAAAPPRPETRVCGCARSGTAPRVCACHAHNADQTAPTRDLSSLPPL